MNEQLKLLVHLQEIDSAILSITEQIEIIPVKLAKEKGSLKEAAGRFETIKTELGKLDRDKKQKYEKLEDIQEKITKLKAKSTEVKTNKEYEAFLKEIQAFESNKNQIEEEILLIMESVEEREGNIRKEEAKFRKVEEQYRNGEKALEEEKNSLFAKMEEYKSKRKDTARNVDKEIYEKYMDLIKSNDGLAVVPAKNEVCLGCNTNIPPQLYNDIKNNTEIFTCYYCNRFLFFKGQ